jgi:hypothetical protein
VLVPFAEQARPASLQASPDGQRRHRPWGGVVAPGVYAANGNGVGPEGVAPFCKPAASPRLSAAEVRVGRVDCCASRRSSARA